MAVRTLQPCLVFAVVGLFAGPLSAFTASNGAIPLDDQGDPLPATASLNQQPPNYNVSLRFLEEPTDVVVARDQNATLRCAAESTTGNVTISWLYEDSPLPPDGDPRWIVDGFDLRVVRVAGGKRATARVNTGDYGCLATNGFGAILSRTAKVKVATIDKEVTISADNSSVYVSQPMLLRCTVHSTPPADIQWEFNYLPLPKDKRYVPLPNGALLLIDTKLNDSGNYRCIAKNTILDKVRVSKDLEVKVSLPPVEKVPPHLHLASPTVNRTVLIGETVEFFCIASGWPTPLVQWINNKNFTLSNSSTLTIRNAHPKDSGTYTCTATNLRGQKSQTFRLDVYQRPYFNTTPVSRVSPSAQTVRIDCQAKGIPQPKILWLKNGKPLVPEIRIKKPWTGLVFSHTVSTDSGIYQCIAVNPAGRIWTAAQIEINNSQSPSPPQEVRCRTYDDDKICLTWKKPANASVQAYSVYSSYTSDGSEAAGPEYLIQDTFQLVRGLKPSTNYTFYVRLYSNHASDYSEKVTCQTGVKSSRNLDMETIGTTSVRLKWDELSSDTLCNGTRDPYVVQWYRDGDDAHLSLGSTLERSFIVSGLLPSTDYQFRVTTENSPVDEPWLLYSLPEVQASENATADPSGELRAPKYVHEDGTTSTSTRLSWDRVANAKYYSVCYVPAKENRECAEDDFTKSYSPKFPVAKLKPNTEYVFRVRAHDSNNVPGAPSQPLVVRTPADVPSPVIDLKFDAVNSTTVCIHWRPPENKNGQLRNYLVSYTIDKNWSLEHLIEYIVPVKPKKTLVCKEDTTSGLVSTFLTNLSTDHTYLVMVRAANEVGIGKPCPPIVVKTYEIANKADRAPESPEQAVDHQKLGIILGIILAALCIVCCITFIMLRRRCLKRRAVARARLAVTNSDHHHHPAVAHYTTQLGTVQVRMEEPCSIEEHEIEHLVSEDHQSSHIPPVTPEHLDTKGANDLPNGYVNGVNKKAVNHVNGFANGHHVHITENPQYFAYECNRNLPMAKNKSEPLLRHRDHHYEEDSNSNNVKPAKFYDFYRLFPPHRSGNFRSKSLMGSCKENFLNGTQSTRLNDDRDAVAAGHHQRRLSPLLEPNG